MAARRLTLPTGRDLDAVHKVKVEIGVGSQSQKMIVVIGRRDRCDGDIGRSSRAGRNEVPRPSEWPRLLRDGQSRRPNGDNFRRARLKNARHMDSAVIKQAGIPRGPLRSIKAAPARLSHAEEAASTATAR